MVNLSPSEAQRDISYHSSISAVMALIDVSPQRLHYETKGVLLLMPDNVVRNAAFLVAIAMLAAVIHTVGRMPSISSEERQRLSVATVERRKSLSH